MLAPLCSLLNLMLEAFIGNAYSLSLYISILHKYLSLFGGYDYYTA
ncbi:hypothetical protein SAMN06265379_10759 [Saccharicrinis carchari]|uniref:Uncharacterized protein n=1 Tax=Saccharicrinis carchari TaxID=1168039 RepID=A0A521DZF3_SACCC|nr:hypothetical protein SAMN06265379_10759 [Saccharicrinis carchari]